MGVQFSKTACYRQGLPPSAVARLPILLPLKLVVGGGVEPPMFTTWVAVLQTALFGHLEKPYNKLVGVDGFGPSRDGVSDRCVNQLRHTPIEIWCRERDSNSQPRDYDSLAPPLCYPDLKLKMVSEAGFEPATYGFRARHSSQTELLTDW